MCFFLLQSALGWHTQRLARTARLTFHHLVFCLLHTRIRLLHLLRPITCSHALQPRPTIPTPFSTLNPQSKACCLRSTPITPLRNNTRCEALDEENFEGAERDYSNGRNFRGVCTAVLDSSQAVEERERGQEYMSYINHTSSPSCYSINHSVLGPKCSSHTCRQLHMKCGNPKSRSLMGPSDVDFALLLVQRCLRLLPTNGR